MIAAMRKYYSYTFVINVCHRMCKGIKNILHSSVLKAVRMSPLIVNACVKLFLVRLKYFIQKQLSKICKILFHLKFLYWLLEIDEATFILLLLVKTVWVVPNNIIILLFYESYKISMIPVYYTKCKHET